MYAIRSYYGCGRRAAAGKKYKMIAENVTIRYGDFAAVKNITMKFPEKSVTALIGPSGCGKTTFLRCLNRMHDMTKNARITSYNVCYTKLLR